MKWIRVIDELPVIPKGKYGISVLIAFFDPCYDECCPGRGYAVTKASWGNYHGKLDFLELCPGIEDDTDWVPFCDPVTHWMYLPEPPAYDPKVLNPIFQHYHDTAFPQSPLKQIPERSERDIIEETYCRT